MGFPPPPLGAALTRAAARGAVDHGGGAALRRGGQRARSPRKPPAWKPGLPLAQARHFSSSFFPRPNAVVAPRSWVQALRSALSNVAPAFRAAARSYATVGSHVPPFTPNFSSAATSSLSRHSAHLARNAPRRAFRPLHSAPRGPRAASFRPSMHHGPGLQTARNFSSGQRVFSDAVINAPILLRAAIDELDDHRDELSGKVMGRGLASAKGKGKAKAVPVIIRPAFASTPGFKSHAKRQRRLATGAYVHGSSVLRAVSLAEAEELAYVRPTLAPSSASSGDASDEASISDDASDADTLTFSDVFDRDRTTESAEGEPATGAPQHQAPPIANRRRGPRAGVTTVLYMPAEPDIARISSRPDVDYDGVLAAAAIAEEEVFDDGLEPLLDRRTLQRISQTSREFRAHELRFVTPVHRLLQELDFLGQGGEGMRNVHLRDEDGRYSMAFEVIFEGFSLDDVETMLREHLGHGRASIIAGWMQEMKLGPGRDDASEPNTPHLQPMTIPTTATTMTVDDDDTSTIHAPSPEALAVSEDDLVLPFADSLHLGASFLNHEDLERHTERDFEAEVGWSTDGDGEASDEVSSVSSNDLPSDWSALDDLSSGSGSDAESRGGNGRGGSKSTYEDGLFPNGSRRHRGLAELLMRQSVMSLPDSGSDSGMGSETEELYDSRLM